MSIIHGQMLLEEDCDEKYEITEKEIEEYATIIGIDPEKEPDLLWIAREGATVPLPPNWRPCKDLDSGDIYYFNIATNETTWDHPCDEFYKNMVIEERHKQMLGLSTVTMKKKNDKKRKNKVEEKNMKDKSQIVNPLSPSRQSLAPITLNPSSPLSLLKPGVLSPIRTSSASTTKDQLIFTNTDRVINSIMGSLTSGPSRDNVVVSKKIVIQNPPKPKPLDTVTSPFLKNALREENIQLLSDMSDDLIPSREAGDDLRAAGSLEYEESDASDHEEGGSMLQYHLSDEEEEEFELQGEVAEKLNAMDISQILAAYEYEKKSPVIRLPKESQDVKRSSSSQNRSGSAKSMEEQLLLLEERSSRDLAIFEEKVAEELDEAKQELEQEKIMKLEQARQEMEKFIEEEKKRLSEDRSIQIKNFEDQIMKEIKEEEKKLLEKKNKDLKEMKEKIEKERKDKEQLFKDELEKALSNMKSEAEKVKIEEGMKIEKEKAIALQKLKKEVEISVTKHKEDLNKQNNTRIEQFKKQLEERHQEAIMELETSFATQKESFTKELEAKHHKELQSITAELEKLRDEEKCRKESEIKILKEKQKTIEDLERGLQTILMEKRKEIQEQQHKELNALHSEHSRTIVKLKQEFNEMTCLLIHFVLFLMLSAFRTFPGWLLLSFVIALFFQQFFFFLLSFKLNSVACVIIGVLHHFFILSLFSWLAVIALDIFLTFSIWKVEKMTRQQLINKFSKYAIFAWGIPLLLIAINLLLNYFSGDDSWQSYYKPFCVIGTFKVVLVFLVIPNLLFIIQNVILYIWTLCIISQTIKSCQIVSTVNKERNRFKITVRLAVIMGLTWIFGVLFFFTKLDIMGYLFIIFNAPLGVFILIFISCRRSVREKIPFLKNLQLGRKSSSGSSSNTDIATNGQDDKITMNHI